MYNYHIIPVGGQDSEKINRIQKRPSVQLGARAKRDAHTGESCTETGWLPLSSPLALSHAQKNKLSFTLHSRLLNKKLPTSDCLRTCAKPRQIRRLISGVTTALDPRGHHHCPPLAVYSRTKSVFKSITKFKNSLLRFLGDK